jgi:hypothetical protein
VGWGGFSALCDDWGERRNKARNGSQNLLNLSNRIWSDLQLMLMDAHNVAHGVALKKANSFLGQGLP